MVFPTDSTSFGLTSSESFSLTPISSSLTVGEKLCAAFIPCIMLFEALIFAVASCFKHRPTEKKRQFRLQDFARLAEESQFSINDVEALYELFKKLSSSIIDDGLIHKEELHLALITSSLGKNLFLDRITTRFTTLFNLGFFFLLNWNHCYFLWFTFQLEFVLMPFSFTSIVKPISFPRSLFLHSYETVWVEVWWGEVNLYSCTLPPSVTVLAVSWMPVLFRWWIVYASQLLSVLFCHIPLALGPLFPG